MNGGIFLIQKNGDLVEMKEQAYDSEDLLQELLADYPNLLAGDQIDTLKPRKWLLISREMAIPDEEEGAGRWSLDHLFLDQDAIPTLVEVKRSTDTRIRREVVGQMFDYAANAVMYWPVEKIRSVFEANCPRDPNELLLDFLEKEDEEAIEEYWSKVNTNLQAGRIRLLFVADEIPSELQRIVEFLNGQMNRAEVLAVEIKQFAGENLRTLVPRVIGQTAEAGRTKGGSRPKRKWDEASFFKALKERDATGISVARKILDWAKANEMAIQWGTGLVGGSLTPVVIHNGNKFKVISVTTEPQEGRIFIQVGDLKNKPPFTDDSKLREFLQRLNAIPGIDISLDVVSDPTPRYPSISYSPLKSDEALELFLDAVDWAVGEIKSAQAF
jgi:hypothetical protein